MATRKRGPFTTDSCANSNKKTVRRLSKATFDKWKRDNEVSHQTMSWLCCELERDKNFVATLYCSVCKRFEQHIQSGRNFSVAWITGSANKKLSNVIDHAKRDAHKAAMSRLHNEQVRQSGSSVVLSSRIGQSLLNLIETTRQRMRKKFDVCYMMAKESVPFVKYPAIVELQSQHGVNLGPVYRTPDSAKAFTSYIAKSLHQEFLDKPSSSTGPKFFSFLIDGTTDVGNQEDELVVLVYCDKNEATSQITTCTCYFSVHTPSRADASGILSCIRDALKQVGIEDLLDSKCVLGVENFPVLVGGGTDGTAVNVAGTGGLKGQLTQALPWIYWSWCYAHCLELACRDVFISPLFSAIENLLLRLYYLYEKSPKKSRNLAAIIIEDLKEIFSFPKGGNLPVRCQGTRWVSHKRKSLQRVLDRYGAYIAHLIALTEDRSIKAEDRERCRGYLHKWKQPKILIGCAMYIEALKPVSLLSLSLQGEGADIVLSMENTMKSVKSLKKLTQHEVSEWPMVKLVKKRLKESDGNQEYQGMAISDFDATLETCSRDVMADLRCLDSKIKDRLEWSDTDLLRAVVAFLSTHNWLMREDTQDSDEEGGIVDPDEVGSDMREAVEYIITAFRAPIEARRFSAEAILDELEEAISYARKYLPIATETYKKIWYTLHTCPDASKWLNVLMLCQLMFSLPFSTIFYQPS